MPAPMIIAKGARMVLVGVLVGGVYISAKVLYDAFIFTFLFQDIVVGDVFKYAEGVRGADLERYINAYSFPVSAVVTYAVGLGVVVLLLSAMWKTCVASMGNTMIYGYSVMIVVVPFPTEVIGSVIRGSAEDLLIVVTGMLANLVFAVLGVRIAGVIEKGGLGRTGRVTV